MASTNVDPNSLLIKRYKPHLVLGHNTESTYRYTLGLLFPICLGFRRMSYYIGLIIRYKYPVVKGHRVMPYMPKIQDNSLQYLIIYTAGYVFWDFLYRNEKYNKNQTPAYKFLQTADLAIFNVMSICVTSGCALALAKIPIYLAKLKIRSRIPLFAVSSIIFLFGIVIAAKLTDMAIDICLDYTFRKHIFNYKEKFTGWDCNDTI